MSGSEDRRPGTTEELEEARAIWQEGDELVIDDGATVLPVEYGMWVQAWVWVSAPANAIDDYVNGLKS